MLERFSLRTARCPTWLLTAACALWGADASAEESYPGHDRFTLLFFGETDYWNTSLDEPDGLNYGQLDTQATVWLNERFSVFSEMTSTVKRNNGSDFEVERLFISYDFSDTYQLSAGRYHTPLGYWNAAYHHGSWLQTTISRPQTVKFGSYVIPIHFVGALLEGKVGQSDFGYRVGVGNGRSQEVNDPIDFGDHNGKLAWMLTGNYRPLRHMLDTGVSVYVDRVKPDAGANIDEIIASAYLALQGEAPEVIVAYTYSAHEQRDNAVPDGSLHSIYAQFGYRLPGGASDFKPYLRAERLDVDDDDPLLGARGLDYNGLTTGIRWDFSTFAALKAEFRREQFDKENYANSFWLQLCFAFDAGHSAALRFLSHPDRMTPP